MKLTGLACFAISKGDPKRSPFFLHMCWNSEIFSFTLFSQIEGYGYQSIQILIYRYMPKLEAALNIKGALTNYREKYGPVSDKEVAMFVFEDLSESRAKGRFSDWKTNKPVDIKYIHVIRLCKKLKTTPNFLYNYER